MITSQFKNVPDEILAKNIGDILEKKYPGHLWGVNVDGKNGIATIFNLMLSGRWGFLVHIRDIDTEYKHIVRAAGELLERYRVKRGALNVDQIATLPRDRVGNIIVDKS